MNKWMIWVVKTPYFWFNTHMTIFLRVFNLDLLKKILKYAKICQDYLSERITPKSIAEIENKVIIRHHNCILTKNYHNILMYQYGNHPIKSKKKQCFFCCSLSWLVSNLSKLTAKPSQLSIKKKKLRSPRYCLQCLTFIGSLSSLAAAWWLSTLEILPTQRGEDDHITNGTNDITPQQWWMVAPSKWSVLCSYIMASYIWMWVDAFRICLDLFSGNCWKPVRVKRLGHDWIACVWIQWTLSMIVMACFHWAPMGEDDLAKVEAVPM